jgi:hypothetical protein
LIEAAFADLRAKADAEQAKAAEAVAEKTRLAADLARRATEVEVMSQQVHVLQDSLSQVIEAAATDQKQAETNALAAAAAQRNDEWDMALAKALAASRSEAELRAKLEQDLEAVTAKLQSRIQREADLNFNQKLFTQMTQDATASLDEIARLVAVHGGPVGGSGMAPQS